MFILLMRHFGRGIVEMFEGTYHNELPRYHPRLRDLTAFYSYSGIGRHFILSATAVAEKGLAIQPNTRSRIVDGYGECLANTDML